MYLSLFYRVTTYYAFIALYIFHSVPIKIKFYSKKQQCVSEQWVISRRTRKQCFIGHMTILQRHNCWPHQINESVSHIFLAKKLVSCFSNKHLIHEYEIQSVGQIHLTVNHSFSCCCLQELIGSTNRRQAQRIQWVWLAGCESSCASSATVGHHPVIW